MTRRSTSARACTTRWVRAASARRSRAAISCSTRTATTARSTRSRPTSSIVMLDPYHNHLDEAWFEINPAGVRGDQFNGDPSWDPIWEAATHVDSLGWTAEMRIPYSQLRFSRDTVQTWGMQIWRYADRLNEQDMWSFWRNERSGRPGVLRHARRARASAAPAAARDSAVRASRASSSSTPTPSDPYHGSSYGRVQRGRRPQVPADVEPHARRDVNPDFGQVEVDPATLNLSAFETFYRREAPVLRRRSSAFNFGGLSCNFCSNTSSLGLFYSRRIGRPPQLNRTTCETTPPFADTPGLHADPRRGEDHGAHEQRLHRRAARCA